MSNNRLFRPVTGRFRQFGVAAMAALMVGLIIPTVHADSAPPVCDIDPCATGCPEADSPYCDLSCDQAGSPRAWEQTIEAGPFSVVKTWSGQLFTVVPIVGFGGRGPDMGIALFHSSEAVTCDMGATGINGNGFGVDLGPGWTMSYSGYVDGTDGDSTITVVEDDGTVNVFTQITGGGYEGPAGVHETLVFDSTTSKWTLTRKHLSKRIFNQDGRLEQVIDSSGHILTVTWKAGVTGIDVIDKITDATGREIWYRYNQLGTDLVTGVYDPMSEDGTINATPTDETREWGFTYTGTTDLMLTEIRDPMYNGVYEIAQPQGPDITIDAPIRFAYDDEGRIVQETDKFESPLNKTFTYTYDNFSRVDTMTDPAELGPITRTLEYEFGSHRNWFLTNYTDRMGTEWQYYLTSDRDLSLTCQDATNTITRYESILAIVGYDADFNVFAMRDAYWYMWLYTYDGNGNLLTATDPLNKQTSYTYDTNNNLLTVTNPNNITVTYEYNDLHDPTLLTKIIEPDDGIANLYTTAETELVYYDTTDETAGKSKGNLWYVKDPNNVITYFKYDKWGQQDEETEGAVITGLRDVDLDIPPNCRIEIHGRNPKGHPTGGGVAGANGADTGTDPFGRLNLSSCRLQCVSKSADSFDSQWVTPGFPHRPTVDYGEADDRRSPGGEISEGQIQYTPQGQVQFLNNYLSIPSASGNHREFQATYDVLGRPLNQLMKTEDSGNNFRQTNYEYDDINGIVSVSVENREIISTLNARGQVTTVEAGAVNGNSDTYESYQYYDNGLLHIATKGTGTTYTTSTYTYRDDGRVSTIVHDTNDGTPQQLIYLYDDAGRVVQISDSGLDGSSYNTVYTYDDRNRLVSEVRSVDGTNATIYHINYSYDNGGNRKTKLTLVPASSTEATIYSDNYYYDTDTVDEAGNPLDAVAKYGSRNNRLMYYTSKKWEVVNGNPTLSSSETTWYYYNGFGHVERIVTKNSDENLYRGTRMEYDKMGRVWRVTNDQWVEDWRYYETSDNALDRTQYWGVLAVDQALSWDNAQSHVDTTYNANHFWYGLAKVRNELELQWFADTFSPEDGSEVKYWIDGYQDANPGDPYCLPGTWGCWLWEAQMGTLYNDPEETYVPWIPVGETPPWPDFNINGGWLAGEPDDVDGVENGQENRMLLVLNRGGVVGDYGFEDAAGSEQHPFLVMAGMSAKDFSPADALGGYQQNWRRRFSYLGDRQRIADVEIGGSDEDHKFTDYVGNAPVLDYWDPSGNTTELTAYVPGLAEIDLFDEVNEVPWAAPVVTYLYTDMLGSTWFKTSDPASGTVTATLSTVRTAFGEIIAVGGTGPDSRYGYVGAHGYQEHDYDSADGGTTYRGDGVPDNLIGRSATDGFPYMHTGARYYNPSTGRFMQRDPIGIRGGANVYEYAHSAPTYLIDPNGLWQFGYCGMEGSGSDIDYGTGSNPHVKVEVHHEPDLTTEEELEYVKKVYKVKKVGVSIGLAGTGAYVGAAIGTLLLPGPGTAAGAALGGIISGVFCVDVVETYDLVTHWDEPINPLY